MDRCSFFTQQAEKILALPITIPVNRLGGYGPDGEVIYRSHPFACPSTLVDHQGQATATFQTNGSLAFEVKLDQGLDVQVLHGSFDSVEKRETGVLSGNCWIEFNINGERKIGSLVNPQMGWNLTPDWIKLVKIGDPQRAMWYCAGFAFAGNKGIQTAVRVRLANGIHGPVLVREVFIKNTSPDIFLANLWTYFDLHGTQRFSYHKNLWYDAGMPVNPTESVVTATVPHENILQIKRISSHVFGCQFEGATCDYTDFIGDTGTFSLLPSAVMRGHLLNKGAGAQLNRFSTPIIAANCFSLALEQDQYACVQQSLLYVTDAELIRHFQSRSSCSDPKYSMISDAFKHAAEDLIESTSQLQKIFEVETDQKSVDHFPPFFIELPANPAIATYMNSNWVGVQELYEKCRAHGAQLADGIELGTRDRAQDMWPKMKEDPGRVRHDLLHAFGFMYVGEILEPMLGHPLTLKEKLHGMFPRQFPSRWLDRNGVVHNDNRPYADSPLWLIESLSMYIRETGDTSILLEIVSSIQLSDMEHPERSGIIGSEFCFKVIDVVGQVFSSYARHIQDSPYGLAQVLFGDWCDPVDMFGTSEVGNPATRGQGRGAQVRLSAHLFLCLIAMIDLVEVPSVRELLVRAGVMDKCSIWQDIADRLRHSIIQWGWEESLDGLSDGFIDCIHELKLNGTCPNYSNGEIGYTLGSMCGSDFDGVHRRLLTTQAYCLEMLNIERSYLSELPERAGLICKLLSTVDRLFIQDQLGLMLFSTPVANTPQAMRMVGRLGVVPSGCAENGEYHHAQMFMHRFRLNVEGEVDRVWQQFKPSLSVTRDETIGGPFEMTSNSFASDPEDPHYGKGMYFGLSGSIDWMVEIFQKMAGVELALHDERKPDVFIKPVLPEDVDGCMTFKRLIFKTLPGGIYKKIPLTIQTKKTSPLNQPGITINGRLVDEACIQDVSVYERLEVLIVTP
ncbi:MAG: hypothetical protein HGA53_05235 [Anaerolineaceae bacterium]|nr:hypothetical protein [Anaerolineaceae bacterium]